jgi:hypothetical protein
MHCLLLRKPKTPKTLKADKKASLIGRQRLKKKAKAVEVAQLKKLPLGDIIKMIPDPKDIVKQEGKYFKSYLISNDQIRAGEGVLIVRSLCVNGVFVGLNGMLKKDLINKNSPLSMLEHNSSFIIPVKVLNSDRGVL